MKSKVLNRAIALMLSLMTVISIMSVGISASARYTDEDIENKISYHELNCREDDCDCLEPENNKFAVVSPSSKTNTHNEYILVDTYQNVQKYFDEQGWTDGLPIVPPTWIKAEKFMRYTPYSDNDIVATVNGRSVTAYQVAVNAIMSGCSAEYLPVCIAFVEALGDTEYLDSLRSGKLTPMMYVNGPIARQLGIDNGQGMTTEECNIAIARFMELALINLAGLERTNAFGNVQPLVYSEDEQNCINIGWDPHHVEEGYDLNDNVITATSFSMWGNNITPATDLPEEIMKVMAWDVTEKNLGGLGGASIEDNANAKRTILITPSVAAALAKKYKSKDALETALVENARRPLWMRTYAYYYSNVGSALIGNKSFSDVYPASKVQITVKNSQGTVMSGQTVTLNLPLGEKRTAVTDTNGVADFGYIRSLYEVSADVSYTDPDGTTKTASTGDFRVGDSDRNVTLTVPKRQLFTIQVNSNATGSGITNAQVKINGASMTHKGSGMYQGMVERTSVLTQNFPLTISADGYQSVSQTLSVLSTSAVTKTYSLNLSEVTLSDSSGNSVGSSLQLYTGVSYNLSVLLPENASLIYSSTNSQIGNYMTFKASGNTLTITPTQETSSGQTITLDVGYTLNSVKYTKPVAISIGQGNIAGPAAPSITSSDLDATEVTFELPQDLKMADKLTIEATGGVDNSVSKTQTYSNITSGGQLTMSFDKPLHGEVSFKCTYSSSRVNYGSNIPVSISKDFWKTVSNVALEKTEYEYTGKPIRPVPQGEHIKSLTYGSLWGDGSFGLVVAQGDFTKLTTDNDITHQVIQGLGSPITYNDCPYAVTVTFDDYCTTGAPNSSGGYFNSQSLLYTIVPRKLTVTLEEQTADENGKLDQTKYSLTSGTMLDGHKLCAALVPDSEDKEQINAYVSVTDDSGNNMGKYYSITCIGGELLSECPHVFNNGICSGCNTYEPPTLNEDGYYEISNAGHLYWFAEFVNKGNANANAILTDDIIVNTGDVAGCGGVKDESWRSWTPIGNNYTYFKFEGVFDGNDHYISGLYHNESTTYNFGLVGTNSGTIKNVTVKNSYLSVKERVGAICGWNEGLIENCANIGSYCKGDLYVGGIAASTSNGIIRNCYNSGTIDCATYRAGGITGLIQYVSAMENCFSCGIVYNVENSNVGALVGLVADDNTTVVEITNCYYDSDVCDDAAFGFNGGANATETISSVEGKTSAQCASGEVAYLLQNEQTEAVWGQEIGKEDYPVLYGDKVYVVTNCKGEEIDYSNTEGIVKHVAFEDGVCTSCKKACEHEWYYDVCEICGMYCGHPKCDAKFSWEKYDGSYYARVELTCTTCGQFADSYSDYAEFKEEVEAVDCVHPGSETYTFSYEYHGEVYSDTKTFEVKSDNHVGEFTNGFCSVCDGYEPATFDEENYVYEISNAGQLYWYAQQANENNSEIPAKLTKDIVIPENAPNWEPINCSSAYFDGNFKTISGLKCIGGDKEYVGLFGCEGWWYEISNLHITDSYFEGKSYVGAVVACMTNGGYVTNCYVTDTTVKSDTDYVGALVGSLSNSNVINCYADTDTLVGYYNDSYSNVENSYYLADEDDGFGGKTAEQFASGEVAYLLQAGIESEDIYDDDWNVIDTIIPEIWGQKIGTDAYPVFGGDKVYYGYLSCATDAQMEYTNSKDVSDTKPEHDEKTPASCTSGAICGGCGEVISDALPHTPDFDHVCSGCGQTIYLVTYDVDEAYIRVTADSMIKPGNDFTAKIERYDTNYMFDSARSLGFEIYIDGERLTQYSLINTVLTIPSEYVNGNIYIKQVGQLFRPEPGDWPCEHIIAGALTPHEVSWSDDYSSATIVAPCALCEGTSDSSYFTTSETKENCIYSQTIYTVRDGDITESIIVGDENIDHTFSGDCDESCANCDYIRENVVDHSFKNGFCEECGIYMPATKNADGDYEIGNAGQLYWFADKVNNDYENFGSANAILTADIVVNEGVMTAETENVRIWTPIGNDSNEYTGTFDGNNKTVSGLYFNHSELKYVGLIGYCNGIVKDVGIVNSYFNGDYAVGSVVGYNCGEIINCYNTGLVYGNNYVGGVVGYNCSTIQYSYNTGNINGNEDVGGVAGGGMSKYTTNCYNTGMVNGNRDVGGVVGINNMGGIVNDCYNTGAVSGTRAVGGVVALNAMSDVLNCYNVGIVSGTNYVGGVVGENVGGDIVSSYYLADSETDSFSGTTFMTLEQFKSGEVAYLLQAGVVGEKVYDEELNEWVTLDPAEIWGQKIGTDEYPVFGGEKVYSGYVDCEATDVSYSNSKLRDTMGHSGGTATCYAQAVCEICSESYGDLLDHKINYIDGYCENDGCTYKAPFFAERYVSYDGDESYETYYFDTINEAFEYATANGSGYIPEKASVTIQSDAVVSSDVTANRCKFDFIVKEDATLTIAENYTVDLSYLDVSNITIDGKVIVNGTLILPEGFDAISIKANLKGSSGTVYVGEKQFYFFEGDLCCYKPHEYEDSICKHCGFMCWHMKVVGGYCYFCKAYCGADKVAGYTISLGDKISVNYYMQLSRFTIEDPDAKMVFTVQNGDSPYTVEIPVSEAEKNGEYYVFTCEVAAKEMSSKIEAQIVTSDSESEVFEYSVKEYAEYIISEAEKVQQNAGGIVGGGISNTATEEQIAYANAAPLVKAMLNYGANAQVYFNYNTENLANASLDDADKALLEELDLSEYASSISGEEEGVSFYGGVLSLKSETAIKLYFEVDSSVDINALDITVDGKEATVQKNGKYYELKISDIPAHKLSEMFEIKIGGLTVNYGAFSYGNIAMGTGKDVLINAIKAMYVYNQAAVTYKGGTN